MMNLPLPQKALTLRSPQGDMRLEVRKRDNGVVLYAYLPDSPLAIVEVGPRTSDALAKMAFNPEVQPWRHTMVTEAHKLPAY